MHFLIIGVGSIGERHLRNFLRLEGVRCSIAEVSPGTRERVAQAYPVEASFGDYRDADLAGYDGVVICVPANLHVAIAKEVVAAGIHVLTEKPLAMSLEGVAELRQLREEKGVTAAVAFCLRTDPLINEAKARIDSGELGTVRWAHYYSGQYWPRMRKDYPPAYALRRETGGGAIPDHLVHVVNSLEWFFGDVEAVSAYQWHMALEGIATEDAGGACLRFAAGQVAQLGICLFQRDTTAGLQLIGDKGTIRMAGGADRLRIFSDEKDCWLDGDATPLDRDDLFMAQAQHFVDCIQGRAAPRCTIEDGERTLRTVLAALESVDGDGGFVQVSRP